MSDEQPRCIHCGQPIPDGEGHRENGLLFASEAHVIAWLDSLDTAGDDE